MTQSHRPSSHGDRSECLGALGPLDNPADLQVVVAAIVVATFATSRRDYEAKIDLVIAAAANVSAARVDRITAETNLDDKFRLWNNTVEDEKGHRLVREVGVVLGSAPSTFLQDKPRTKLVTMRRALPTFVLRKDLNGNLERLAALEQATDNFEVYLEVWEAAVRARKDAVGKLNVATVEFDKAYTLLVEAILRYDVDAVATLPVFHRKPARNEVDEEVEREDSEEEDVESLPDDEPAEGPAPGSAVD